MSRLAPGLLVLAIILLRHYNWSYQLFIEYLPANQAKSLLVGATVAVAAWIIGQLLSAAHDVLEHCLDSVWPVEWGFFFWASPEQVEKFEDHYFNYYVFCSSTALGLLLLLFIFTVRGSCPSKVATILSILLVFFATDAILLRKEIRKVLHDWSFKAPRGKAN